MTDKEFIDRVKKYAEDIRETIEEAKDVQLFTLQGLIDLCTDYDNKAPAQPTRVGSYVGFGEMSSEDEDWLRWGGY